MERRRVSELEVQIRYLQGDIKRAGGNAIMLYLCRMLKLELDHVKYKQEDEKKKSQKIPRN